MNSQLNVTQSHMSSEQESSVEEIVTPCYKNGRQLELASKKKRIVRKKYKPRKKDVLIHTICILNKKNFRAENCIIETFLMTNQQQSANQSGKNIQSTIQKKDGQYLQKIRENIKFSQNLMDKVSGQTELRNLTPDQGFGRMNQNILSGQPANYKWVQSPQTSYNLSLLSQYIGTLSYRGTFG